MRLQETNGQCEQENRGVVKDENDEDEDEDEEDATKRERARTVVVVITGRTCIYDTTQDDLA
jgi:hypothetical protein